MTNKQKYILVFSLFLIPILITLAYFLVSRQSTNDVQYTISYPVSNSEPISFSELPTEDCSEQYSNELYPGFAFEYDKCFWDVREEVAKEHNESDIKFPVKYKIYLTNTSNSQLTITLDTPVLFGLTGETECYPNSTEDIDDRFSRFTRDNIKWRYAPKEEVILSGTAAFEEIRNATDLMFGTPRIDSETRFCTQLLPFSLSFESKYTGRELGFGERVNYPDKKTTTFITLELDYSADSEALLKSDQTVGSFIY